ncbi:MAG: peptide deformylase [Syntrophorhabdaceae bacterium]|nr:peptide deformylase [Syntrophorhabdaceae bacterium]
MPFLEIVTYPNPILRKVAQPVKEINDEVVRISKDMVERMRLARGAGLAANQCGINMRIIVLESNLKKDRDPLIVLNPVIVEKDREEVVEEEGCLSFPKYFEHIGRSRKVYVKGIDLDGKELSIECEDHLARAFQHEVDHLNGVLFIDYLSPVKRTLFKKRYVTPKSIK